MAGEFGICGNGLRIRPPLAYDQFAVAEIEGLVLALMLEVEPPHDWNGVLSLVLAVKVCLQGRPLVRDAGVGITADLT